MSDRNWKRTQRQRQAVERALQQRLDEIEAPVIQKKITPGFRRVVICVPGAVATVKEAFEGPHDDA